MNTSIDLNDKAIGEFRKGRRFLDDYFRDHRQPDLEKARDHLRELTFEAPGYLDGWLMLGLALTENRQETEAVDAYEHAVRRINNPNDLQSIEARLQIAKSRLRLYLWEPTIQALTELRAIETALNTLISSRADQPNLASYQILRTRTYVEIAHCYGHLLVHLQTTSLAAATQSLSDLGDIQLPPAHQPVPAGALVARIYDKHADYLRRAAGDLSAPATSQFLKARLSEVEGYGRFRKAQWLPPDQDDAFRAECKAALIALEQAEVDNPMNYALLQNIGMIYLLRRFDPQGDHLGTAERYYKKSRDLKPNDYYAHQQLAVMYIRRAADVIAREGARAPKEQPQVLRDGETAIATAMELRGRSLGQRLLRLALWIMQWRLATAPEDRASKRKEIQTELDELSAQGTVTDTPRLAWSFGWMKVVWLVEQLRDCAEGEFDNRHGQLRKAIAQVLTATSPAANENWLAREIHQDTQRLHTQVPAIRFSTRRQLTASLSTALE